MLCALEVLWRPEKVHFGGISYIVVNRRKFLYLSLETSYFIVGAPKRLLNYLVCLKMNSYKLSILIQIFVLQVYVVEYICCQNLKGDHR